MKTQSNAYKKLENNEENAKNPICEHTYKISNLYVKPFPSKKSIQYIREIDPVLQPFSPDHRDTHQPNLTHSKRIRHRKK